MSTISDYRDALVDMVPGSHPLDPVELLNIQTRAVAKAMAAHSKHRPRPVVEDMVGDGGFDYAVSGLADWVDDFSGIRTVECPVDDSQRGNAILDPDDWQIYEKPAGKVLRLLNEKPLASESMRITYTGHHTCDGSDCTVPSADEVAVQSLAAAFYCRMLAAAYALDQDSTVAADTVNQGPRHKAFLDLSAKFEGEYNDHMGIKPGKPKAAISIRDQDVFYPGGGDRLTHPSRYR